MQALKQQHWNERWSSLRGRT